MIDRLMRAQIGLCVRRAAELACEPLCERAPKIDVQVFRDGYNDADSLNRLLLDKERVAAALEDEDIAREVARLTRDVAA